MSTPIDDAVSLMREQRERYVESHRLLLAQRKGVESKIVKLSAQVEALDESINSLLQLAARKESK